MTQISYHGESTWKNGGCRIPAGKAEKEKKGHVQQTAIIKTIWYEFSRLAHKNNFAEVVDH